ncbi:hypothetical protein Goklo_029449, partial [Gossypium klotzschianum]|nr:hypothetical protein [Gossypium klotzschianum]
MSPASALTRDVHETRVCELIDSLSVGWKEDRVREIYGEVLGDQICNIPILHNGPEDHRIWFHNPLGSYSTKSAYSWITLKHMGFGPHRRDFNCLCPRCGIERETLILAVKDCPKARAVLTYGGLDNALVEGCFRVLWTGLKTQP